jgi:hypothetical protein
VLVMIFSLFVMIFSIFVIVPVIVFFSAHVNLLK